MALLRNQVTVDGVTFNAEPFEWPRSNWEVLEIKLTTRTGWHDLTAANLAALNALYNGAEGSAEKGLEGWLVQYIGGTGGGTVSVSDWRGNSGSYVFRPNDGLVVEEVQGAAESMTPLSGGFWTATIRLLKA